MKKYECIICGYVYDEEQGDSGSGIAAGTKFEELPEDWVCPVCGASKDEFTAL
ncbi:MAG TPA: rubredoxin [Oscillospiraceae bacterium]|nr:rubredoxin [Oscillospiraceae bacterium]